MDWIILIIALASLIYSFYYKNKVLKDKKSSALNLTRDEKLRVCISEFFCPIFVGAVYYYGWRKKLPKKASQANKYSWIVFLALWLVGIAISFLASGK